MGGISDEQVEWAVVNRLKAMLDAPPQTHFNVTQTFALFSAVLMWTKNRVFVPYADAPADFAAQGVRDAMKNQLITEAPWRLARVLPAWGESAPAMPQMAEKINADFEGMTAEAFFKWLRDALAHGDGRVIRPLHKPSHDYRREWLGGFVIEFEEKRGATRELRLTLTETEMRRLGATLADVFCAALADDLDYAQRDEATRIVEAAA